MADNKRHSSAEIAAKLQHATRLVTEGKTQAEIARALGISIMTYHRWRKAQPEAVSSTAGLNVDPTHLPSFDQHVTELQLENARLRRLVTDLLLEKIQLEEHLARRPKQSR